jgi:release factor glutamine methyltransferase
MPIANKRVVFGGYAFNIVDDVYEPSEDTMLFVENLVVDEGERVLDVGTGCGVLGILAAARARVVVAVDVNPYALGCALANARLNQMICNIEFVRGDLFTWLTPHEKFDLVLFNAPYLPTEDKKNMSWVEHAWAGGPNGRVVIDRFIWQVSDHVNQGGRVLMLQSTLAGVEETFQAFREVNWKPKVIAERSLPFFETIKLIEARP